MSAISERPQKAEQTQTEHLLLRGVLQGTPHLIV
jgi:hypothetical protein